TFPMVKVASLKNERRRRFAPAAPSFSVSKSGLDPSRPEKIEACRDVSQFHDYRRWELRSIQPCFQVGILRTNEKVVGPLEVVVDITRLGQMWLSQVALRGQRIVEVVEVDGATGIVDRERFVRIAAAVARDVPQLENNWRVRQRPVDLERILL